jgi:hypothetical protein
LTRSLKTALELLQLDKAFVLHAGERTFSLHERVTAIAAARLLTDLPLP